MAQRNSLAIDQTLWGKIVIQTIDNQLMNNANNNILTIVGRKGGEGKTTLAEWLYFRGLMDDTKSVQVICATSPRDIFLIWDPSKKIIIFDLPAQHNLSTQDGEIIAQIKEGIVQQQTYKQLIKKSKDFKPIVIVFLNTIPSEDVLKQDKFKNNCFEIVEGDLCELDC